MENLFVPFQITKALFEAGCKLPMYAAWHFVDGSGTPYYVWRTDKHCHPNTVMLGLPSYDQVIDWFVEHHKFYIWVECETTPEWIWTINCIQKGDYIQSDDWVLNGPNLGPTSFKTRQEALNAAITRAIELLKKTK